MLAPLATSFAEPGKVTFYNVVLFIHIAAAVVAFGVTFGYPIIGVVAQLSSRRPCLSCTPCSAGSAGG